MATTQSRVREMRREMAATELAICMGDPEVRERISLMWRSSAGSASWLVAFTTSTSISGAELVDDTFAMLMLVWSFIAPSALLIPDIVYRICYFLVNIFSLGEK